MTRGARLALWEAKRKTKKKGFTAVPVQKSESEADQDDASLLAFVPTAVAALSLVEALFLYAHHSISFDGIKVFFRS